MYAQRFMTFCITKGENRVEDLKAIIKRSVEAWNTGNLAIVDEIYAKDLVNHNL